MAATTMGFFLHPSVSRRVLFGQAIVPPFFTLDANHSAVATFLSARPHRVTFAEKPAGELSLMS